MLIYALTDRNGSWRYVGKTHKTLAGRLRQHMREADRGSRRHVYNWIRSLGYDPKIVAIEERQSSEDLIQAEIEWIAEARRVGVGLTNLTEGGDGFKGRHSIESRAKMSRSQQGLSKGRSHSAETRARLSAMRVGKPLSEGAKKRMSVARTGQRGFRHSEETKARIGAANSGRSPARETREKMSLAHLGRAVSAETRLRMREARLRFLTTKAKAPHV